MKRQTDLPSTIEKIVLFCLLGGLAAWIFHFEGLSLYEISPKEALPFVSGLSSIAAALLGFLIAIVIFLLGLVEGPTFKILRASNQYVNLWSIFKSSMISCGLSSLLGLYLMIAMWGGETSIFIVWLFLSSLIWLAMTVAKIVWVINKIIDGEIAQGAKSRRKVED